MPTLRIALAQVDPTVGDLAGNASLVRGWTRKAAESGAHLVAFPEMMLTGYPVEDLVFRESFVAASRTALTQLAADLVEDGLGDTAVIVGYLDADGPARVSAEATPGRGPRNALAVLHRGAVVATYFKHHLPNYGVFDEDRYFVPGDTLQVVRLGGVDVALTICEDLWQTGGPFAVAAAANVGLVVNINGSPYELDKDDVRLPLVRRRAAEAEGDRRVREHGRRSGRARVRRRLDGGGGGRDPARAGHAVRRGAAHRRPRPAGRRRRPAAARRPRCGSTGSVAGELAPLGDGRANPPVGQRLPAEAEVWQALVLGLRDYVRKNGFRSVIIALSGGIDSAVVAAIAVDAVGADQVHGVSMPSDYSSQHSKDDAADLAARTGLHYQVEPIQPMVDAFLSNIALSGLAVENLQARVRGVILMALSNQDNHLVLTTGNKSELAVGYSTLYGDSVGGFNPLKDVPKTLVWRLAKWRNAEAQRRGETPPIPENSIAKPPSAELRPGQLDTDSLPEYDELDALLADYVDGDMGRTGLIAAGHDPAVVDRVLRMVDLAEYKRRQSAPGPKISIKSFGRDRRLPITNRYRERSS